MASFTTVTARRCRDLYDPRHGRLMPHSFRFHRHRPAVYWSDGEVAVTFKSWAKAQAAVTAARGGDWGLWDQAAAGA